MLLAWQLMKQSRGRELDDMNGRHRSDDHFFSVDSYATGSRKKLNGHRSFRQGRPQPPPPAPPYHDTRRDDDDLVPSSR